MICLSCFDMAAWTSCASSAQAIHVRIPKTYTNCGKAIGLQFVDVGFVDAMILELLDTADLVRGVLLFDLICSDGSRHVRRAAIEV